MGTGKHPSGTPMREKIILSKVLRDRPLPMREALRIHPGRPQIGQKSCPVSPLDPSYALLNQLLSLGDASGGLVERLGSTRAV